MVKKKFIFKFLLICFIIILVFSLLVLFYVKLTFKKDYVNMINENLQEITLKSPQITTNFILSIIKQESSFNKNAKSSSDAFGLMQLTYPTAKEMANKMGIEISLKDLFIPEINIKLGINYINYLFTIFDDKQLVIISYNAGFNKVKSWIENGELEVKNGLYLTPYKETTNYLKKVLQNEKVYNLI